MRNKLILIHGAKQAGKDTLAKCFLKDGYSKGSFAGYMKQISVPIIKLVFPDLEENEEFVFDFESEAFKSMIIPSKYNTKKMTFRLWLQIFGTEFIRKHISEDYHCAHLNDSINLFPNLKKIVIPDWRMENELFYTADKQLGKYDILTIKVIRPSLVQNDTHSTEIPLTDTLTNYIFVNDGGLEKFDEFYKELKDCNLV